MLHCLTNVLSMQQCRKNCQQKKHVGAEITKRQYLAASNRHTIATDTWPVRHYPLRRGFGVRFEEMYKLSHVVVMQKPCFAAHTVQSTTIRNNDGVSPGQHVLIANLQRRRWKMSAPKFATCTSGTSARPSARDTTVSVDFIKQLTAMSIMQKVEDLIEDALCGGRGLCFVTCFLNVRQSGPRSYKRMHDLRFDWLRRGTRTGPRWCTTFAKSLWTCFLSLRRWSTGSVEGDRTLENLTKSQAAAVSCASAAWWLTANPILGRRP